MKRNTVKALRMYTQQTQAEFAESLGLSRSAIAMVENGFREPSERLSAAIARTYPITPEFISFLIDFENMDKFIHNTKIT